MKKFDQFHDGFVNGVLVEGAVAHVFLATYTGQQFVLAIEGLSGLKLEEFREGNIILDVLTRDGDELTIADVMELYGYRDEVSALKNLESVRDENLALLEINPSYGASLLALAKTIQLISREDWVNGFFGLFHTGCALMPVSAPCF